MAPRPRGQDAPKEAPKVVAPAPIARAQSNTGKGKASAKGTSANLRVVPPKVAAQWGPAELSSDDAHSVGADKVAFVAPATLNKVRARLGEHQDGTPLLVNLRVKRDEEEKEETPEAEAPKEGEEQPEEEPPLEAWLAAWEEMPTGCLALSGELEPEWKNWGMAK